MLFTSFSTPHTAAVAAFSTCRRGWAGELITPAGIAGPRPSSTEALIPGWTAGRTGKGARLDTTSTDVCRSRGDECGVGDCLKWNLGS